MFSSFCLIPFFLQLLADPWHKPFTYQTRFLAHRKRPVEANLLSALLVLGADAAALNGDGCTAELVAQRAGHLLCQQILQVVLAEEEKDSNTTSGCAYLGWVWLGWVSQCAFRSTTGSA